MKRNRVMDENKTTLIVADKQDISSEDSATKMDHDDDIDLPISTNENHQHFENIYNSSAETITSSDGIDVVSSTLSLDSNSGETNTYDVKENHTTYKVNTYNNDKTKTRFQKKLVHNNNCNSKKRKNHWVLKFNCPRIKSGSSSSNCSEPDIPDTSQEVESCICTGYRRTENQVENTEDTALDVPVFLPKQNFEPFSCEKWHFAKSQSINTKIEKEVEPEAVPGNSASPIAEPVIDLAKFNPEDYPIEDCDERARLERAREIAEGVDPPPGFSPKHQIELVCHELSLNNLTALFQSALSLSALSQIDVPKSVHTQIDYIHCLVPDLLQITSSSFYWGKMDRYEAEKLLENKPEGTFLLRDSAQEEYLFSVSFRKYGRSLHARIEQWNHRFSFDSHDPGVFASNTVCGLIEHYKDPTCCMFFEPMLTIPLHRNFPFSLHHLCRAVICDHLNYDSISYLKLPKTLKTYLKEYHYKQRVRVRKFESEP